MVRPRVTVCIPTFNRWFFLRQALHSLCNQDLDPNDFVVAISDNASTDDTPKVVAQYKSQLQIKYHRNTENIGFRRNLDMVASLCDTPYLSFLCDDDLIAPGHLGRAVSLLDSRAGSVLVASIAVLQEHPGAVGSYLHGVFLRGDGDTPYDEPYIWNRAEWLALALVTTPLSSVGSVFRFEAFRRCELCKPYTIWWDRMLLAEMGLYGEVLSLPWVGGYYRIGRHQTNVQIGSDFAHEVERVTADILKISERHAIPVVQFWIDQIVKSNSLERAYYLDLLRKGLQPSRYAEIKDSIELRLGWKPDRPGRLERWGIPSHYARRLRSIRDALFNPLDS